MGTVALADTYVTDTYEEDTKEHLELLHLQADVEPDGSSAILSIHTTEGQLDLAITIEQMSATITEMWEAGSVMIKRQLNGHDKGRAAFDGIIRRAPLAATITPTIDKLTGDVVVVYRFPDRMPFSVRVSQEQFLRARAAFSAELKRSSN